VLSKDEVESSSRLQNTRPGKPVIKTAAVAEPAITKQRRIPVTVDTVTGARPLPPRSTPAAVTAIPAVAVVIVAAYIAAQMVADIASLKIGVVAGLAVDMGTFIYPITFTLRDVVHKVLGKRNAQVLIVTAAVINLLMAAYLLWAAAVPSDPLWGLGEQFSAILAPVWRIVLASIAAELVSELVDTEVYHWFVTRITTRYQWARVLASNSVSVPIDNLVFAVGAFAGVLPWSVVWEIFLINLLVKYAVTLVSLPLIYTAPDRDWRDETGE
jgi:queuosine precursor transporter